MAQQKLPSDVRLLTPAHLREIRAKVLRWIQDNPKNIRALMQSSVEMLESIIRYRLRERLGPAAPKLPVLGGIGVAYGALPVGFSCVPFLESGWVYLPTFEQPGAVFLTEEVGNAAELDYLEVNNNTFYFDSSRQDGYTDGMESLAFPATEKRVYHQGSDTPPKHPVNRSAMSGKLKLLYQSMLATQPPVQSDFLLTFEWANTADESYGIYSHPDKFDFYLIRIKDGLIHAALLNYSDCGNLLQTYMNANYTSRPKRDDSILGNRETLKYESYLFGTVQGADEWQAIGSYDPILGEAIYYGFVFNLDGTEARMTTHELIGVTGAYEHITSRTYVLTLTDSAEAPIATLEIDVTKTANWTPRFNGDNIWHPDDAQNTALLQFWYPLPCNETWLNGDVSGDAILYEWYYDDEDIGQLIYSLEEIAAVSNVYEARDAWLASIEQCGSMAESNIWFSGPARKQGFIIKKDQDIIADATGFNAANGLKYEVSIDITVTYSDTSYCRNTPANIQSMCDWDKVEYSWNSCQLSGCDSRNTRAIQKDCGSVVYTRKELKFTQVYSQSFVVFPFHSPESVFIGVSQRLTGDYTEITASNTGFVGYRAYAAIGPRPCSFELRYEGQLITPSNNQAKDAIGCNWTASVIDQPYNNEPWSEETLEYWFAPNEIDSDTLATRDPIKLESILWLNTSAQMPNTGYSGLFNPFVCGPLTYPYYSVKIKNDETANYKDRFYIGSLLTAPDHVAETDVSVTYASVGIWEGWV